METETECIFIAFLPTLALLVNNFESLLLNFLGSNSKSHGAFHKSTRKNRHKKFQH